MTHMERLQKGRINLLLDEPFFGSLMMQLMPVQDPTVPTFRTDGERLWFNPEYMDTLSDPQLRTILAHEVMHPAMLHPYRLGKRDLRLANVAADYAINNLLDQYNQQASARGETPPFHWPTHLNEAGETKLGVLLDHQYDNMSFEEIYDALNRPSPSGQSGNGSGSNGVPAPNGQPGTGDGETPSSPGEFCAGSADEAEAQTQEAKWKVALKQAAVIAKGQGRMPSGAERFINELLDPQLSWREILRTLLTSAAKDDYTWTRPNRRFSGGGIMMPSLHVPRMGKIVVAIDTSGSIGSRELAEFLAEIRAIMFDCRPEKLVIVQCDAEVHEWLELDPFDDVDVQMKGGGGTDFCPVFDRVAQEPEPPAALVYLTDMYGSFPEEAPSYPVIWAANSNRKGPFGDTVHIK